MKWTKDKLELIKAYLLQGQTYSEIGKSLKLTYDQIQHAVHRYNLKEDVDNNTIFKREKNKLTKDDIDVLTRLIGEGMFNNYKKIKLIEPKPYIGEGKREEVSVLTLSDAHIGTLNTVFDGETGKKITTYNEEIFKQELYTLQNSIVEIHEILSHSYSLKKLIIFVLGDMLTNDRIYEGQEWEVEKIVGLQLWDAVVYFTKFFNNLLSTYETIEIVGVVGNHGRSQPLADTENEPVEQNFEYHLYRIWQKQFEESKRIKVIVPNTRRFIYNVNGWNHLIEHGDAIKGMSEQALIKQIKELYINTQFDVFQMGHVLTLKK